MLYACAYELAALGSTPWCSIFEQNEILDFEYELDLLMNYACTPFSSLFFPFRRLRLEEEDCCGSRAFSPSPST
jgi:hypothetical protein